MAAVNDEGESYGDFWEGWTKDLEKKFILVGKLVAVYGVGLVVLNHLLNKFF